jgi:CrcB protein
LTSSRPPLAPALAVVAVGGAAGALLRSGLATWFPDEPAAFPWTILTVNVAGCFVLALLPGLAVVRRSPLLPPLLGAGVLGGFTTLSTYSEQARVLLATGHGGLAATYVVGTLAACLGAVTVASRWTDRRLSRSRADR